MPRLLMALASRCPASIPPTSTPRPSQPPTLDLNADNGDIVGGGRDKWRHRRLRRPWKCWLRLWIFYLSSTTVSSTGSSTTPPSSLPLKLSSGSDIGGAEAYLRLRLLSTHSSDTGDSLHCLAAQLSTALSACLFCNCWAGLIFALHHLSASPPPHRRHPQLLFPSPPFRAFYSPT